MGSSFLFLELGTGHFHVALLAPLSPGWLRGLGGDCHGPSSVLLACTALAAQ